MKNITKLVILAIVLNRSLSAVVINFSSYSLVHDEAGTDVGDVYRFEDITTQNGSNVDALMTVTGSTLTESGFNGVEGIVGNDARLRLVHEIGYATMRIDFVQDGVDTLLTNPLLNLSVLFDDIDSDDGRDGSDFAGVMTSDYDNAYLNSTTNLGLNTAIVPNFTIAHLQPDGLGVDPTDFAEWGNNTSTDAAGQSVSSVAFEIDSATSVNLVVGQLGPTPGFRHIDLDITPDFTLTDPVAATIPEPSSLSLLLAVSAMLLGRRRR